MANTQAKIDWEIRKQEALRQFLRHVGPIQVYRRLRADIPHERMAKMADPIKMDPTKMDPTAPCVYETRYRTHSNSYEYLVEGVGWMSKKEYSLLKKKILVENW